MPKHFPLTSKGYNPFCDMVGLEFSGCESGESRCFLEVNEKLYNPQNVLHGAVLYAMADTGMGAALYSLMEEDEGCATSEISIVYFKAVRSGRLTCHTKVLHKGKRLSAMESRGSLLPFVAMMKIDCRGEFRSFWPSICLNHRPDEFLGMTGFPGRLSRRIPWLEIVAWPLS